MQVKCDERPNGCANCERLQLDCSRHGQSSSPLSSSRPKSRRTFRSCAECRVGRAKCSGDRPACSRCRDKGIECRYGNGAEPAWQRRLSSVAGIDHTADGPRDANSAQLDGEPEAPALAWCASTQLDLSALGKLTGARLTLPHLPHKAKVSVLVEKYFAHIHPIRCFAFLHRPSFLRRVDEEINSSSSASALLYIVCALGAQ
jgi:hypothetical protein